MAREKLSTSDAKLDEDANRAHVAVIFALDSKLTVCDTHGRRAANYTPHLRTGITERNQPSVTILMAEYVKEGFELFGGIALNRSAGGLNPYALEQILN